MSCHFTTRTVVTRCTGRPTAGPTLPLVVSFPLRCCYCPIVLGVYLYTHIHTPRVHIPRAHIHTSLRSITTRTLYPVAESMSSWENTTEWVR
jgi:hypothetical protein